MEGVVEALAQLQLNEERKKEALPVKELETYAAALGSPDPQIQAKAVELIGELARVKKNRKRLGRVSGIVQNLQRLLRNTSLDIQKWAARALGNLSYDNAKMINRIVQVGVAPDLISLLRSSNTELQRNATGAVANLASQAQEDHINTALIGGGVLAPVIELLKSDNDTIQYLASRVLLNLADNENNQVDIPQAGGLVALLSMLEGTQFQNVQIEAIGALAFLCENVQNGVDLAKGGGLPVLYGFLNSADEDLRKASYDLLNTLAQEEEVRPEFLRAGVLQACLNAVQEHNTKLETLSLSLLAHLTANEEIMLETYSHLTMLLGLLKIPVPETQLNAAVVLGNMARNDAHSLALMEAGCVPMLIELMGSTDHRLQHVASGAIRNLSIPAENKRKMVELGALPNLIKLLSSQNAHTMYSGIGAVKSLMAIRENRDAFVQEGGLQKLIALKDAIVINAPSDDDKEEDTPKPKDRRVQFEAARTLAILTEDEDKRDTIVKEDGLGLLNFLLDSPFDILHFEGARALHNLSSVGSAYHEAVLAQGLLEPLVSLITRAETVKVRLAVLSVLRFSAESDEQCRKVLLETGICDILASVKSQPEASAEVLDAAQQLLVLLRPSEDAQK